MSLIENQEVDLNEDETKCGNCEKSNKLYLDKANAYSRQIQQLLDLNDEKNKYSRDLELQLTQMQSLVDKSEQIFKAKEACCANLQLLRLCEILMDLYVENEKFYEAMQLAVNYLIGAYNLYLPEFHPTKGLMYFKIVKLALNLNDLETARKFFPKIEEVLIKTHDESHSLMKELKFISLELQNSCY